MTITESIKFDKLQEENETLKKELAEKDKEIESAESRIESAYEKILIEKDKEIEDLEKEWEKLVCEKYDLQQTQLYKEDFKISEFCINCGAGLFYTEYYQKIKKGRKINLSTKKCSYCGSDRIIKLKDNSLYDKLPSKDVK